MPVSSDDKVKAVEKYMATFSAGDVEGICSLYADDATVEDPVGTPVKEGIDAIREFYTGAVTGGTQLGLTGDVRCAGDSAAFPFEARTERGDISGKVSIIDVFRFNDEGKVIEMRAFWGPENMQRS